MLASHRVQVPNLIVAWSRFLVRFFQQDGNSPFCTQPRYPQPVVSDAVVVWRAWALFTDERWMLTLPILLLTATTGKAPAPLRHYSVDRSTVVTFTFLGYDVRFIRHASSPTAAQPNFLGNLFTARITLSFTTNVVATLLIAYKLSYVNDESLMNSLLVESGILLLTCILRKHRRIVKTLGLGKGTSQGQKALLLLIESGAVYCALQVRIPISRVTNTQNTSYRL